MDFELSKQQLQVVAQCKRWFGGSDRKAFFALAGYAGTGKTSIAQVLAAECGRAIYLTPTGKAAQVLASKGCSPSQTIHSMIYQPKPPSLAYLRDLERQLEDRKARGITPEELRSFERRIELERANCSTPGFSPLDVTDLGAYDIVVVDESSMVPENIAMDLLRHRVPVLALGDPGQLPPVRGSGYFLRSPDATLTEIHRQAEGNPILLLATQARKGETIRVGEYQGSRVVPRGTLSADELLASDQIIVGLNRTRRRVNSWYRGQLGRLSPYPEPGDRLICLRNDKDLGLINGGQWVCDGVLNLVEQMRGVEGPALFLDIRSLDDPGVFHTGVPVHAHHFDPTLGEIPYGERRDAQEFDFGYAISCHKSQGSQWDDVVVLDESQVFRQDADRWLYTALTRAAKRVTLVKG